MRLFSMRRVELCRVPARVVLALICLLGGQSLGRSQSEVQEERLRYLGTEGHNRVTELFAKVEAGDVSLEYQPEFGYLPSLLDALEVPVSSQSMVFSKTSLQMGRISPENPRAIYFNDDVYIGWVQGSPLLEISTTDPQLGAAFYTVRMTPRRAALRRENDRCLACHKVPMTQGVPGHGVRSVLTRPSGVINSLTRASITDHTSPIADRWGGWYVTGDLGGMQHMGNSFLEDDELVAQGNLQREDLRDDFDTSRWLSAHSDVVALMVLEHQTQMQNAFTRANHEVRRAVDADPAGDGDPDGDGNADQALEAVIDRSAKRIVDYMLFSDEAKLHAPIRGSTPFAEEFTQRGPACGDGRSLREFDLETRLFRHPCSYLIYSSAFASLDDRVRRQVYRRLWRVLTGQDTSQAYAHLGPGARASILRILRETKDDLPGYWMEG